MKGQPLVTCICRRDSLLTGPKQGRRRPATYPAQLSSKSACGDSSRVRKLSVPQALLRQRSPQENDYHCRPAARAAMSSTYSFSKPSAWPSSLCRDCGRRSISCSSSSSVSSLCRRQLFSIALCSLFSFRPSHPWVAMIRLRRRWRQRSSRIRSYGGDGHADQIGIKDVQERRVPLLFHVWLVE